MLYFVLILAVIALFALWRVEVGECEDAKFYSKCYCAKCDEEIELRRIADDHVTALEQENRSLERRCEGLQNKCDALARENANIYSEREKLRKCTVEYAFSEWERREVEDIPGMVEYERDGIVLMYECGKIVGWRAADTAMTLFKNVPDVVPGNEDDVINELPPRGKADEGGEEISSIGEGTCVEDDTQGTYEAPSAEVV